MLKFSEIQINESNSHIPYDKYTYLLLAYLLDDTILDFLSFEGNKYKSHVAYTLKSSIVNNLLNRPKIYFDINLKPHLDSITFDIEKDWNKFKNIDYISKQIINEYGNISKIHIDLNDLEINDVSFSHQTSDHKMDDFINTLFGDLNRKNANYDVFIRYWLMLIFKHCTPNAINLIEKFIYHTHISNITFESYFKIKPDDEYRHFGVLYNKKNYKYLHMLLNQMIKDVNNFKDWQSFIVEYRNLKKNILCNTILLPKIKSQIDEHKTKKTILSLLSQKMKDSEHVNLNNFKKIPSKNQILSLNPTFHINFYTTNNEDLAFVVKGFLDDDEMLCIITTEIGWDQLPPKKNLSYKVKIDYSYY